MSNKQYKDYIKCPHCGKINYCPCIVCKNRKKLNFIRSDNGRGPVLCGNCKRVIRTH